MVLYTRYQGQWLQPEDMYVKKAGVWTPAKTVQQKQAGVWTQVHDNVPPPLASVYVELDLRAGTNQSTGDRWRYFNARVGLTDGQTNPNCEMIRVLVRTDAYPSSPDGQGYVSGSTPGYPNEAWSDFYFYGNGSTHNTYNGKSKNYPYNYSSTTQLPGGKTYYISAWARDQRGNWGPRTVNKITMPTKFVDDGVVYKAARFTPDDMASRAVSSDYDLATNPWDDVNLTVGYPAGSTGLTKTGTYFFYGHSFADKIPFYATVTKAQLLIHRSSVAHGTSGGANRPNLMITRRTERDDVDEQHLDQQYAPDNPGEMLLGQGVWLTFPEAGRTQLANINARGMGVVGADNQLVDQIKLTHPNSYPRLGELYVEWTEE